MDDDLLRKQQEAYRVEGVDEEVQSTQQLKRKRKEHASLKVGVFLRKKRERHPN